MTGAGTPASVLPAPIPFGNYHLLELINTGGMAEVYKAKSYGVEGFERIVAVKRILPNVAANEEFIRMFVDEAKLAGQLSHSNIAQIFDLGRADGMHYIALEYVPGRDLRTVWKQAKSLGHRLPIDLACWIVLKACEGLDYAHDKTDSMGNPLQIVHRDVSPQNILLSWDGEVKLIDFGLAKAANSSAETRVGVLKGKLAYMSPEQVRGIPLDRRTDIFSVGIVLWELLTGERLFVGESDFETLEKVRKVEVAPPSLYDPSIPADLEDIVLRALQKNPNHRFQTAGEFQHALQRFLFGSDLAPGSRDVSALMADFFAEEIAEERRIMEAFQKMRIGSPHVLFENPDDLAWGEEESETQVFAKTSRDGAPSASQPALTSSWADDDDDDGDLLSAPSTLPPTSPTESGSHAGVSRSGVSAPVTPAPVAPPRAAARSGAPPRASTAKSGAPPRTTGSQPAAKAAPPRRSGAPPALPTGVPRASGAQPVIPPEMEKAAAAPAAAPPASQNNTFTIVLVLALIALVVVGVVFMSRGDGTPDPGSVQVVVSPTEARIRVLVDGTEVHEGASSQLVRNVAAGERRLAIEADGFVRHEARVRVNPGSTERVAVALEALPATTWDIVSEPAGATVRIGTTERGVTPLQVGDLEAGRAYAIVLTLDGYKPETRSITFAPGMEALSVTLEALEAEAPAPEAPPMRTIRVTSTPEGATVAMTTPAGETTPLGVTPLTTDALPAGTYQFRFTLDGHDEGTTSVALGADADGQARVRLRASAPAAEPERVAAAERPTRTETPRTETPRTERTPRETTPRTETPRERTPAAEPARTPAPEPAADGPPGTLSVQSRPAAMVSIDGRELGYTPIVRHSLPPGRYRIDLRNPDFGLDRSYRVVIESGRERTIINRPE